MMESILEAEKTMKEPLLRTQFLSESKGGSKILPFIIVNEAFEKVASFGVLPNMILYLMREYGMESSQAATVLFLWAAASNLLPVLGALLADSYVGRFPMIGLGSITSLVGMILLWLTTIVPQLKPTPCDQTSNSCTSPTTFQIMFLYSSLGLMSIGGGCIRSSSLAFGADQLDNTEMLGKYFSWYYVSTSVSVIIAVTGVVYVQDNMGWEVGFGVPVVLMCISAVSFFLASPFYVKRRGNPSLLTGLAQVLVSSYRNRNTELPSQNMIGLYHQNKESTLQAPSDKLRFLNKACIIRNPREDQILEGRATDPRVLCTVNQVEELKALIRVIPMWSSCIMMSVVLGQSFVTLQLSSMDRHLTRNFEIPAGSFSVFLVLSLTLWITVYNSILLPVASRIMGKPVRLGLKKRMGAGLVFSSFSIAAIAIVERVRRETARQEGFSDDPKAVLNMSAMWLVPHFMLGGLAEAFNAIGQTEFYYSELPKSMSSIASTLFGVGMSCGSMTAGLIVSMVDDVTKKGGKESWVSSNINKGHYDYYYWLLTVLSSINFMYYLACCKAYGPCQTDGVNTVKVSDGNNITDEVGESKC